MLAVVAASPARAEGPLEAAIAEAAHRNQSLVIELRADWCAPCVYFEKHVLTRPDVELALRKVFFVRYDIDTPTGEMVARRLGVGAVPTFVVFDSTGVERARYSGVTNNPVQWFLDLLKNSAAGQLSTADLEAAVKANPDDHVARKRLAAHYRAIGRALEAQDQYKAIVTAATADRALAAEAQAEVDEIATSEARTKNAVDTAVAFVTQFPDSPLASERLAMLAVSRRVLRPQLVELAKPHLELVHAEHRANAVRAALVAGLLGEARTAVATWLARDPNDKATHLINAEVAFYDGDFATAKADIERVCQQPQGFELWCGFLQRSLQQRSRRSVGVEQMRIRAGSYIYALEHPGAQATHYGLERLVLLDPVFGNAIARLVQDIEDKCAPLSSSRHALMTIDLFPRAAVPASVHVQANEREVATCVENTARTRSLPAPPPELENHMHLPVYFQATRRSLLEESMSARGLLVAGIMREGDIKSRGFSIEGQIDVFGWTWRHSPWRIIVAGRAEAGIGLEANAYAARALVGVASDGDTFLGFRFRHTIEFLGGVGTSSFPPEMSQPLEVPIGWRLRAQMRNVALHVWALMNVRTLDDELGIAASTHSFAHLYIGVTLDIRDGTSGSLTIGIPIGSFY